MFFNTSFSPLYFVFFDDAITSILRNRMYPKTQTNGFEIVMRHLLEDLRRAWDRLSPREDKVEEIDSHKLERSLRCRVKKFL